MFSGECRLTDIHDSVQAEAGNATWTPEFHPVERPERRVLESLLWVFHLCGMCCAIVGDFATYMADKFASSSDVTTYVAFRLQTNTCQSDACQWNRVGDYYTIFEILYPYMNIIFFSGTWIIRWLLVSLIDRSFTEFEDLTALTIHIVVPRVITPCSLVDVYGKFSGAYCLTLQGRKILHWIWRQYFILVSPCIFMD